MKCVDCACLFTCEKASSNNNQCDKFKEIQRTTTRLEKNECGYFEFRRNE